MNTTIKLNLLGVDFTCQGTYNKVIPGDHEQPEEGGDFELETVEIAGNDVTDIINRVVFEAIKQEINLNINEYI